MTTIRHPRTFGARRDDCAVMNCPDTPMFKIRTRRRWLPSERDDLVAKPKRKSKNKRGRMRKG